MFHVEQSGTISTTIQHKPHKNRKITGQTIEEIALYVAECCTETEAAQLAGVRPDTWFSWKGRLKNASRFSEAFTRVKAAKIRGCIKNMQKFVDKDWRVSDRLLERYDPARFSDRASQFNVNVALVPSQAVADALLAAYGPAKASLTESTTKALPVVG